MTTDAKNVTTIQPAGLTPVLASLVQGVNSATGETVSLTMSKQEAKAEIGRINRANVTRDKADSTMLWGIHRLAVANAHDVLGFPSFSAMCAALLPTCDASDLRRKRSHAAFMVALGVPIGTGKETAFRPLYKLAGKGQADMDRPRGIYMAVDVDLREQLTASEWEELIGIVYPKAAADTTDTTDAPDAADDTTDAGTSPDGISAMAKLAAFAGSVEWATYLDSDDTSLVPSDLLRTLAELAAPFAGK